VTIMAGIASRVQGVPVEDATRDELRRLMSRYTGDKVIEFGDRSSFFAKVDIGAFGAPAAYGDEAGNISMLAGEPLLCDTPNSEVADRYEDLRRLHAEWIQSNWDGLTNCCGTYCAVHYNRRDHRIGLIADKVGLRPIYYWVGPELVVFATALRILENLDAVPKEMDLRGVTEIACFGYPLADRTVYLGISTLRAGEVVHVSEKSVHKLEYWRWDRLSPSKANPSEVSRDAYRRFMAGVKRRVRGESTAVAFLSGGLDSRVIAAALRSCNVNIHTVNYAPRQTQDEVFATDASKVLGTTHHYLEWDPSRLADGGPLYNRIGVTALLESVNSKSATSPQRRLVWSGDGGSVGLGHVHLNAEIVALAHAGETEAAVDAFRRSNSFGIPRRLFKPNIVDTIVSIPTRGIRDELARLECADRGRAFHLFLMLNDQRRMKFHFFENIDLERFELQYPFFDSEFLELILSNPVNDFLGHHFYMEWLKNFSPAITSVPWQAYPGHVPCPLPIREELRYQWSSQSWDHATRRRAKQALLAHGRRFLGAASFPDKIIDRGRLRLAVWLTGTGIRNYDYLIRTAAVYWKYWNASEAAADQRMH
jgi:asparagine synthase (glutamine-hydrolysing)